MWWLDHVTAIFWIVRQAPSLHPFGSRPRSGRLVHFVSVAAAFIIPIVPILSAISGAIENTGSSSNNNVTGLSLMSSTGLGFQNGPTLTLCYLSDLKIFFYTYIYLLVILQGVGCTIFILIFYYIYMVNFKAYKYYCTQFL